MQGKVQRTCPLRRARRTTRQRMSCHPLGTIHPMLAMTGVRMPALRMIEKQVHTGAQICMSSMQDEMHLKHVPMDMLELKTCLTKIRHARSGKTSLVRSSSSGACCSWKAPVPWCKRRQSAAQILRVKHKPNPQGLSNDKSVRPSRSRSHVLSSAHAHCEDLETTRIKVSWSSAAQPPLYTSFTKASKSPYTARLTAIEALVDAPGGRSRPALSSTSI